MADNVEVIKKIKALEWDKLKIKDGNFQSGIKEYEGADGKTIAVVLTTNLSAFTKKGATVASLTKEFVNKYDNIRAVENGDYADDKNFVYIASLLAEDMEDDEDEPAFDAITDNDDIAVELGITQAIIDDIENRLNLIYSASDWSIQLMGGC
jgi:hypothetical protein